MKKNLKSLMIGLMVMVSMLLVGCQKKELTEDEKNALYRTARESVREYQHVDKYDFPDLSAFLREYKISKEMFTLLYASDYIPGKLNFYDPKEVWTFDFTNMNVKRYRMELVELGITLNEKIGDAVASKKYTNRPDYELYDDNPEFTDIYNAYDVDETNYLDMDHETRINVRRDLFRVMLAQMYEAEKIKLLSSDKATIDAMVKHAIEILDPTDLQDADIIDLALYLNDAQWYFIEEGDETSLPTVENREKDEELNGHLFQFCIDNTDNATIGFEPKPTDSNTNLTLGIAEEGRDANKYTGSVYLSEGEYELFLDSDDKLDAVCYGYTKNNDLIVKVYLSGTGFWKTLYTSKSSDNNVNRIIHNPKNTVLSIKRDKTRGNYLELMLNNENEYYVAIWNYYIDDIKDKILWDYHEEDYFLPFPPGYNFREDYIKKFGSNVINPKF